jgi:hypothetical protein
VECACVGEGLDFRPGVPADGQACKQRTRIDLMTLTRSVAMTVQKPSVRAGAVDVVFTAAGEIGFTASYNMSMTRVRPTDGATPLQRLNSAAYEWSWIGQQRMSMDGHHVVWQGKPPSADSAVDLSFDAKRFSFRRTFALSIELNCTAGEPCVEDGDVVHTHVAVMSVVDGLVSEVVISTAVESLVSCDLSHGRIEGLMEDKVSVSALSSIKVHIEARDCDGLPINYTRADIQFSFDNQSLAVTWKRGSNEYTADVPTDLTALPGRYALVVTASQAWNETAGQMMRCELHSRTIEVTTAVDIQTIIIGAVTTAYPAYCFTQQDALAEAGRIFGHNAALMERMASAYGNAGVRTRWFVAAGTGHAIPGAKTLGEALDWLEEGAADRRRLANEFPAMRQPAEPPDRATSSPRCPARPSRS